MPKGYKKRPRTLRKIGTVERIRRYWRPIMVIFGGIFLITIPWVFGGGFSREQGSNQPASQQFVAKIDEKPFGNEIEVNRIFRERLRMLAQFLPFSKQSPEQLVGLRISAIMEVIDNYILGLEATKAGITVSDRELLDAIEQEMNSLVGPPPAENKEKDKNISLKDFFSAIKMKRDPRKDAFLRYIVAQYGSYETYRDFKRQQVLADRMRARITDQVKPRIESEAKKMAQEWLESLKSGKSFTELVKSLQGNANVSATPETGRTGLRGELPQDLADLAFTTPLNEWRLAETTSGVYVYQILSRREAAGPDYERERPALEQQILNEKKAAQSEDSPFSTTPSVDELEIKRRYEKATIRYLLYRIDVNPAVTEEVAKLREKHKVQILDPYALYNEAMEEKKWDEALAALEKIPPAESDPARIAYLKAVVWERKFTELRTDPAKTTESQAALDKAIQFYETAMKTGESEGTQNPYYYLMGGRMYWYTAAWDKVLATFLKGAEFAGNDDMLLLNFERQIRSLPEVPGKADAMKKIAELRQKAKEAQQKFAEQFNKRLSQTSSGTASAPTSASPDSAKSPAKNESASNPQKVDSQAP